MTLVNWSLMPGSDTMIDWELAERVGQAIAGGEGANGATPLPGELGPMAETAREGVVAYARMQPTEELPPPEAIGRAVWMQANLRTMRGTLATVALPHGVPRRGSR